MPHVSVFSQTQLIFSFFTPPDTRPDPPPVVWAGVGHLVPAKGFDLLLRAVAGVVADGFDVRLHLAGDGPEREALQALACDLRIRHRVQFHGYVSRVDVRRLLQQAHGYVLASRHETFGIPVVEALACGCAVVATRCGGPEYVLPTDSGHLVEPESVEALHDGLRQVTRALQDDSCTLPEPDVRSVLQKRFSYDTFVTNTTALYQTAYRRRAVHR